MYCLRCYAELRDSAERTCWRCGLVFDPQTPQTFLTRPFPRRGRLIRQIIITTLLGFGAAFVVAMFQAARASGH